MQKQKNILAKIAPAVSAVFFLALANVQIALGQQGWNVSNYDQTGLPKQTVSAIVTNIAFWLLAGFGFIAVIGFVISGIIYLTSAGDEDRQEIAQRAMIYSITGVLVGLAGLVIIYAVDALFRAQTF